MPFLTQTHLEQTFRAAQDTLTSDLAISEQLEVLLGLLVLKRASDQAAIPGGASLHVPPQASWSHLRDEITHDLAAGLDEAVGALREANPSLANSLGAVDFAAATGALSDADPVLRTAIELFGRISLRDEDLAFPGLLGRACDTLVERVETQLPVDGCQLPVARMMARVAGVGPGKRLFDPCIGAGELLVAARGEVDWAGGDPATLELRGEGADRRSCAVTQLALLLHGWTEADIVAAEPELVEGEADRPGADIVLTRIRGSRPASEAERALRCLHSGLAALRPCGVMAAHVDGAALASTPAGRAACRDLVAGDLLEAVVAVPAVAINESEQESLVLVLRAHDAEGRSGKPPDRQGKVLFIDVGSAAELRPTSCKRVLAAFEDFAGAPRFAVVVASDTVAAGGYDLSPQHALEAAARPERQDVRAHLIGGVPVSEVEPKSADLDAVGLDPSSLLVPATEPTQLSLFDQRPRPEVDEQYLAFRWDLVDREDLASVVEDDAGVQDQRAELGAALETWWSDHAPDFLHLTRETSLHDLRTALRDSLVTELVPVGTLNRLEIRGAAEAWWRVIEADIRTLQARGSFLAVAASWLLAIQDSAGGHPGGRDPLHHPVVRHLLPDPASTDADSRGALVRRVMQAARDLDEVSARAIVLAIAYERLVDALNLEFDDRLGSVIAQVEMWWDKYHSSLRALEAKRADARAKLDALMREWGYV